MVESNEGLLAALVAALKRWLKADDGRVALPTTQQLSMATAISSVVSFSTTPAPCATEEANANTAPPPSAKGFLLAARLKSVAKLNPRKDRVSIRSPKRPGKPVNAVPPAVKRPGETRHVWLRTRARPSTHATTAQIVQLPSRGRPARPARGLAVRSAA